LSWTIDSYSIIIYPMSALTQQILIILTVIVGGAAISYFYFSVDIFMSILKKPLKMISAGMLAINIGVALVVFLAFNGTSDVGLHGLPLSSLFYILYFAGSIMVIYGSRQFTHRSTR